MPKVEGYRHILPEMTTDAVFPGNAQKHGTAGPACFESTAPRTTSKRVFTLRRWLLCSLMLTACGCGDSAQDRAERKIAELVKDHNARMVVDENRPNHPIVKLDFSDTKTYDAELAPLADLFDLEELVLTGTKITDAAVDSFASLPQLRILTLSDDQITNASLAKLAKLPRLQCLGLGGTRITDEGLAALEDCKNLQVLYLNRTEVSESAAKRLRDVLPQARIVR